MDFTIYLGQHYRLSHTEATTSLLIVFIAILVITLFSMRRDNTPPEPFSRTTSTTLKGVAILVLILSHFVIERVHGNYIFEYTAGTWAVTIFLFITGVGLSRSYALSGVPPDFVYARIKKLLPTTWMVLLLVIFFDYLLLDMPITPVKAAQLFMGIITFRDINPPLWYIPYIIVIYSIYFLVSKLSMSSMVKIFSILTVCCLMSIAIWGVKPIFYHLEIWCKYALVFPVALFIGLYYVPISRWILNNKLISSFVMLLCSYLFIFQPKCSVIRGFIDSYAFRETIGMAYNFPIMFVILYISVLLDHYRTRFLFLILLGEYSFEMFLVHFPLMTNYDFLLFHKPLVIMIILYLTISFMVSFLLKKIMQRLVLP